MYALIAVMEVLNEVGAYSVGRIGNRGHVGVVQCRVRMRIAHATYNRISACAQRII